MGYQKRLGIINQQTRLIRWFSYNSDRWAVPHSVVVTFECGLPTSNYFDRRNERFRVTINIRMRSLEVWPL